MQLPERRPRQKLPAILSLHGFPGADQLPEVTAALQDSGLAVLRFHARGAWGSDGVYRFSKLVPDSRAALRFLAGRTEIDPKRIGVLGFSMGGWTALNLAAGREDLRAVAAIAPAGGPEMRAVLNREFVERHADVLRVGSISRLCSDALRALERWNPYEAVPRIACPLFLSHGTADEAVPFEVSSRLKALARAPLQWRPFEGVGHHFFGKRAELAQAVSEFFAARL